MRFIKLTSSALALGLLSAWSLAYVQRPGYFKEIPGMQEFTGQMIVRPKQPADLAKAGKGTFEQFVVRSRAQARLRTLSGSYVPETDEYIVNLPPGENENSYSAKMMATGDYQYVEPNWRCYPVANPNDPRFGQQWHHQVVKSPQAWDFLTGSNSIIVAVVDTGIDLSHPDLAPNRVPGYNSVDQLAEVDGGQVNDLNGHGTHVAGDAAAIGNNGVGVAGMGWNFKIMMVRTSNSASGSAPISAITNGARWAADNGARAVSASYSGVDSSAVGTTGTYIKTKGALFSYAAGNDNRNLTGFNHPDTIVVGATDPNDLKASFSAYGPAVHVFAPGVNILSTTLGGGYGNSSGTSMATPIVNGAIGLIFAANPLLTPNEAQEVLESQCDVIGPSSIFGHGRINQFKNMQYVFATNPVDASVDSISTFLGTHMSGVLADILNPNTGGASYDVWSEYVEKLGYASGVQVDFTVDAEPSSLVRLKLTLQTKLGVGTIPATGFVYAFDNNVGKYVSIGQFSLYGSTFQMNEIDLTTDLARFVNGKGRVSVLLRGVGSRFGGRIAPVPFLMSVGYANLKYSAFP